MTFEKLADAREDFIKRSFAVSVSVGFASQMTRFFGDAIKHPDHFVGSLFEQHGHEIALLVVSLIAVVASWEGYLTSIYRRPLKDRLRFYIDVGIVFAYLVLMLTVQEETFWLWTLTTIFGVYAIWDVISMRIPIEPGRSSDAESDATHARSLTITMIWFVFFIALAWLSHHGNNVGFTFTALAAVAGVVGYRVDKWMRRGWLWKAGLLTIPVVLLFASTRT